MLVKQPGEASVPTKVEVTVEAAVEVPVTAEAPEVTEPAVARKKWTPKTAAGGSAPAAASAATPATDETERTSVPEAVPAPAAGEPIEGAGAPARKKWEPKKNVKAPQSGE
jgi:hypothetical protein